MMLHMQNTFSMYMKIVVVSASKILFRLLLFFFFLDDSPEKETARKTLCFRKRWIQRFQNLGSRQASSQRQDIFHFFKRSLPVLKFVKILFSLIVQKFKKWSRTCRALVACISTIQVSCMSFTLLFPRTKATGKAAGIASSLKFPMTTTLQWDFIQYGG